VYKSVQYWEPLIPQVRNPGEQMKHMVMTILPKDEWASLFLYWAKELQTQQETMSGRENITTKTFLKALHYIFWQE
jgi:hypothetical protein